MIRIDQALQRRALLLSAAATPAAAPFGPAFACSNKATEPTMIDIQYRTQQVGPVEVFYREAGPADAPVILLLHGFPTASHMFRDLIPALADRYRVIAPDLPGFGLTKAPVRGEFEHSFDNMAEVDTNGVDGTLSYTFDSKRRGAGDFGTFVLAVSGTCSETTSASASSATRLRCATPCSRHAASSAATSGS